jgi:hypothetical protein
MSYTDVIICIEPDLFLETWPPIYRGQERTVRDRLRVSQVDHHVYSRYTPCLIDFTFEFIWRPIPPILSPSSRTFVELTLVNRCHCHQTSVLLPNLLSILVLPETIFYYRRSPLIGYLFTKTIWYVFLAIFFVVFLCEPLLLFVSWQ